MIRTRFGRSIGLLTLTTALVFAACDDDDPTGPGTVEVGSMALVAGETALVEIVGETVTGSFAIDAEAETEAFDVVAYDDEDEPIDLTGYHLTVEVEDDEVALYVADGDEAFRGHLEGVAAGTTTVVFRITTGAGGTGTVIYTSPEIDVAVN
jgi:hypothetical protein